jgi:chitinase
MAISVIYYNSGNPKISLGGMSQLSYTNVIVANLQPTSPGDWTLKGWGTAFDDQLQNNIRLLQRSDKKVLISFGGANNHKSGLGKAAYEYYAGNVTGLVNQILSFVNYYNFDGVDIDYEDDAGFGDNAAYDGVEFLSALTSGLYQALPSSKRLISHAPAPPYWDSGSSYARGGTAPYYQIWQNVGNQISWFNNQFYDNPAYDATAALKVEKYQAIAGLTGAGQQLIGALVGNPALYEPKHQDEGYISLDHFVDNVISPLIAQYGFNFGGVVGWEFAQDGPPTYSSAGYWSAGIFTALAEVNGG